MARSPESAFVRFRRSGDNRALAEVFDLTAAELLRVASHLVPDLNVAEDLVQNTFLSAIEDRHRYDPSRSLLPWLTGILINRARAHHRSDRRPDPARLAPCPAPTPGEQAEARELSRSVSDAIAALPEVYRPVLTLHLRHGLNAREIALALERPPGTVRTQVVRGIELLRKALPAGLAVGAVTGPGATSGLAAVRATVLEAGSKVTGPVATTAMFGGILIMKKLLLVSAGLIVASGLAWMVWPEPPPAPTVQAPSESVIASQMPGAEGLDNTNSTPEPLPRQPAAASGPSAHTVFRGRCVDARTGDPLQGITVTLTGLPLTAAREYEAVHGPVDWQDPPAITTGPGGTFEFRFTPPPPYRFILEIRAADRLTLRGTFRDIAPDEERDFSDLRLSRGATVTGQVLDTDGIPQGDVSVNLDGLPTYGSEGDLRIRRPSRAQTNGSGTFAFPDPIPLGSWEVYPSRRHLAEPTKLHIAEVDRTKNLLVSVKRPSDIETITGTVVDQFGAPVDGARIKHSSEGWGRVPRVLSDPEGRFRIERGNRDRADPTRFTVTKEGYEVLRSDEEYPWGTSGVMLTLPRGLGLEILVTDALTGEPVEEFSIRRFPDPSAEFRYWRSSYTEPQHRGTHEGGRLLVSGIPRGPNMLLIEPDPPYLPSEFIRFEMTERGTHRQEVEVDRATEVTLRVVDPEGEAVPGTKVQLLRPAQHEPVDLETWHTTLEHLSFPLPLDRDWSLVLQDGLTDEAGELRLSGPAKRTLAIALLGPGHRQAVFNEIVLDPERETLRLQVTSGATILGKLEPAGILDGYRPTPEELMSRGRSLEDLADYLPGVFLQKPGGPRDRPPFGYETYPLRVWERVVLNHDGSFTMQGIPPGTWDLNFIYAVLDPSGYQRSHETLIAGLNLREGQERHLELDINRLRRARLNGTVLLNDQPLVDAQVVMRGEMPDGSNVAKQGSVRTGPDGSFSIKLLPASYAITVYASSSFGTEVTEIPHRDRTVLQPGQQLETTFHFSTARMRLRAFGSDGRTPLEGITLYALMEEPGGRDRWSQAEVTDAAGFAELPLVPSGTLSLSTYPRNLASDEARDAYWRQHGQWPGRITVKTLVVDGKAGEIELDLVMPESSGY